MVQKDIARIAFETVWVIQFRVDVQRHSDKCLNGLKINEVYKSLYLFAFFTFLRESLKMTLLAVEFFVLAAFEMVSKI